MKGPIGNGGGGQDNQSYFDDVAWHNSRGLRSSGYVIYHDEYINAIVPLAASLPDQTKKGNIKANVFSTDFSISRVFDETSKSLCFSC